MLKDRMRLAVARKRTLVIAVMALVAPLTALAAASPAMAEPSGIFKIFNQCPTEIPGLEGCSYAVTTSGEFNLGATEVPIKNAVVLQGGLFPTGNPENPAEYFSLPAKDKESLSKTEQNVPGGLLDFIKCEEITGSGPIETFFREECKKIFEGPLTGVTATTELVANETNPVILNERALNKEEGTALTLPVRVHLKNVLLGNSCYVGSEKEPLELHLTTGATKLSSPPAGWKSIHGAKGKPKTLEEHELEMLKITGNSLVDNTFPSPGAEGCGEAEIFGYKITGYFDSIVDGKAKIPNKAGENTAILNGELNSTSPETVIESEKY